MASEQGSNVVLNFQTNGQVQYAQTIKQINMVMSTAAKEYQNQLLAMGRDADATDKLRAEKQKLEKQMTGSSEKVRMLREEYEEMQESTDATAEDLQKLYNQLLSAESAHTKLEQSLERVNDGLSDEAIASREAVKEMNNLKDEADELQREQKKLTSSYELQTAELGNNASESEKVALAQRQIQDQMRLSERAVANLESQLDTARRAYGENSREVMELETSLNGARTSLRRFENQLDDVEEAAEESAKGFDKIKGAAGALAGLGTAAAVKGIVDETQELSTALTRLESNASAWGFTSDIVNESFKKVSAVSGDAGAAIETVSNLMSTNFTDSQLAESIEYINGAVVQFAGTLSSEGIADGIQETFATGAAAGSFGELLERSGVVLDDFNKGLGQSIKMGTETDYVLKTLASTGVGSFYESYQQSNGALIEANEAAVEQEVAMAALGDVLRPLVTAVTEFTTKIVTFAAENPVLTKTLIGVTVAVAGLVAIMSVIAPIVTMFGVVSGGAAVGVGAFMAALLPIIGVIAAVVVAVVAIIAIVKNWGSITDWFSDKWKKFSSAMAGPIEKAKEGISKAINAIKKLFDFEFKWPKLRMPKFSINGSMNPLKWLEEGVPKLSVKWNAKGGIFTQPTIFGASGGKLQGAGEAGPEAVLPLNESTLGAIGRAIAETINIDGGGKVVVEQMIVRDDQDIRKIAIELHKYQENVKRGR